MIILSNLSLSFGQHIIFNNLNVTFQPNDRVGIVGRNGSGKSTLLKIITGLQQADNGTVSIGRTLSCAYLPQEVVFSSHKSVFDEAYVIFEHFTRLQARKIHLEHELEQQSDTAEKLLEEYTVILDQLASFDQEAAQQQTHTILTGLGFSPQQLKQSVDTLSVGWKMRLVLAKLLLQRADFYLFDEPTNHLDLHSKEWCFNFLQSTTSGFLLVSHDRYFLDHACTKIFELERGNGTLYHGNFSFYVTQKEHNLAITRAAYKRQQKEITHKETIINKFRASSSRAKQAQSMIKKLERMKRIEPEPPLPTINLTFPTGTQPGKVVLTVDHVAHSFDNQILFKHISFELMRGEKAALIAPNGTGKTTLFNLITQKYPLQRGSITLGHNVSMAFFEQDQMRALDQHKTIFEQVAYQCPRSSESTIRSFLGSFLFSGDDVHKKIHVLSGGEKNRVAMVIVLLQQANFLLLDEPTNHLDLYAKEILLQALQKYNGTILIVSHDHTFIQQLATRIFVLTPNGITNFPGTYEEYLAHTKQQNASHTDTTLSSTHKQKIVSSDQKSIAKKIRLLERTIHQLEKKQETTQEQLVHYAYDTPQYQQLLRTLHTIQENLTQTMKEWEELMQKQ